jgi:hypothetical protein
VSHAAGAIRVARSCVVHHHDAGHRQVSMLAGACIFSDWGALKALGACVLIRNHWQEHHASVGVAICMASVCLTGNCSAAACNCFRPPNVALVALVAPRLQPCATVQVSPSRAVLSYTRALASLKLDGKHMCTHDIPGLVHSPNKHLVCAHGHVKSICSVGKLDGSLTCTCTAFPPACVTMWTTACPLQDLAACGCGCVRRVAAPIEPCRVQLASYLSTAGGAHGRPKGLGTAAATGGRRIPSHPFLPTSFVALPQCIAHHVLYTALA